MIIDVVVHGVPATRATSLRSERLTRTLLIVPRVFCKKVKFYGPQGDFKCLKLELI